VIERCVPVSSVRAEGFGEPGVGFPEFNGSRRVRAKRTARSKNAGRVLPVSRSNDVEKILP
jgi:hypothetical protein